MLLACLQGDEGFQVVAEHFGCNVLHDGELREAGDVFEVQTLLQSFERLLNPPALVVEIAKDRGWKFLGVHQAGHEDADGTR